MTRPVWEWQQLREAVDPASFGRRPEATVLEQWIDCYAADDRHKNTHIRELKRPSPLEQAIEKAIDRDDANGVLLSLCAQNKRTGQWKRDEKAVEALFELPGYLQNPLMQQLKHFRAQQYQAEKNNQSARPATRYIRGKLTQILERIRRTDEHFKTHAYQRFVVAERLDELLHLPRLTKREIQTAATLTAGAFDGLFCRLSDEYDKNFGLDEALAVYQKLANTALLLNINPPAWPALKMDARRRTEPDIHKLPGALARIRCATWWQRKLWRLRRIWREEHARAACLVSRTTSAYLSKDALSDFREQRRKMREFLKSYELVNEDGFTLDFEAAYYAGNSNPTHRRCEMMATIKGMELIAEERGDKATFLTVTCPSRFHATLDSGHPNPKWDGSTIRGSSDYLVNTFFAGVRKKLNREKLRWYGVRVAEPHHDGTVHWHMLMFTRPEDLEIITDIVRAFAIHEDRAELGSNIEPRFKSELITSDKGTPTSYIATYIGKNIDSAAIGGNDPQTGKPRIDNDTGKPMAETVEHVIGWAGLHGVRQFQFFGIPSRQTYRELRRLALQMERQSDGPKKLPDPDMDNVLVAADAGCFASYITSQGGVLTPRKDHIVRTAYDIAEKTNDYGENGTQIYGIWSPLQGAASRICTHPDTWTLVRKTNKTHEPAQTRPFDFDLECGPAAPWTRGNNCPPEQNTDNKTHQAALQPLNIGALTEQEIRKLKKDMLRMPPPRFTGPGDRLKGKQKPSILIPPPELLSPIQAFLERCGMPADDVLVWSFMRGCGIRFGDRVMRHIGWQGFVIGAVGRYCKRCHNSIDGDNAETGNGCEKCKKENEG